MRFRELWHNVFGDSYEVIDHFVASHYRPENTLLIEQEVDGATKTVAMVHLIEFNSPIGRVGYLYALAVDPQFRMLGYGKELTLRAIEVSRVKGYKAVLLIPEEERLHEYYTKLGFKSWGEVRFSTLDGYDFGTGVKERDIAMIYPLSTDYNQADPPFSTLTKAEFR